MKKCNQNLKEALEILTELKELALQGKMGAETPENLRFFSLIWDVSLRVSGIVQQEIDSHKTSGKWN
jgi:hypothetical protein